MTAGLTLQYDTAALFLNEIAARPDAADIMAPWTQKEENAVKLKASVHRALLVLDTAADATARLDRAALDHHFAASWRNRQGHPRDSGDFRSSRRPWSRRSAVLLVQLHQWVSCAMIDGLLLVFFGAMLTVFPQTWLCQRYPTGKVGLCSFRARLTSDLRLQRLHVWRYDLCHHWS